MASERQTGSPAEYLALMRDRMTRIVGIGSLPILSVKSTVPAFADGRLKTVTMDAPCERVGYKCRHSAGDWFDSTFLLFPTWCSQLAWYLKLHQAKADDVVVRTGVEEQTDATWRRKGNTQSECP